MSHWSMALFSESCACANRLEIGS